MTRRVIVVLLALLPASFASAQQLVPATEPVLVNCDEHPCFRLTVNAVDREGRAISIGKPFKVSDGSTDYPVFYDSAIDAPGAEKRSTYWMLLLDLSGSMLSRLGTGTRLDAAREAIRGAVRGIRPGVDNFALVPFESHKVRETVAAARFESSVDGALARLAAIPRPARGANDTALYTAAYEALDVLKRYQTQGNDVSLVVFTDGKNDVPAAHGNDVGLLGDEGLELVKQRAREYNIQIKTLGFGARGEPAFDEATLRQLAFPDERQYAYAADSASVQRILTQSAQALANRVRLTFGPVGTTKGQLRGQTLRFSVTATSGGSSVATASPVVWSAPPIQEPGFADLLTVAEEKAFFAQNLDIKTPISWPWLSQLMTFGIFAAVLSIGWFGIPRLLWPERYIPKPNFPLPASNAARAGAGTGRPQGTAPQQRSGPPRRAPAPGDSGATQSPVSSRPEDLPLHGRPTGRPSPPRGRPAAPRDPDDATIYIPRGKKYEKDS